jgi:hypothetical protein
MTRSLLQCDNERLEHLERKLFVRANRAAHPDWLPAQVSLLHLLLQKNLQRRVERISWRRSDLQVSISNI